MSEAKRGPVALGFLGGSFDPFHLGHLNILQALQKQGWPDRLFVIPAWQAPLKGHVPLFSSEQRLQQLRAVQQENQGLFDILTIELERQQVSYTWETVEVLRRQFPDAELWWIIGGDQFAQLQHWKRIDWLVQQIGFLVCPRPGFQLQPPAGMSGLRWHPIDAVQFDLSSTQIRQALQRGEPVEHLVPAAIADYFRQKPN